MTRRKPSVFTGASTGPNLIALGVWNLSNSMPCPSGVRIIARVARTSLSPIRLPTEGPSTVVSPSSFEAQFDEERFGGFEIVDNDEDVVHPFNRPVLPSLAALVILLLAVRCVLL